MADLPPVYLNVTFNSGNYYSKELLTYNPSYIVLNVHNLFSPTPVAIVPNKLLPIEVIHFN